MVEPKYEIIFDYMIYNDEGSTGVLKDETPEEVRVLYEEYKKIKESKELKI